MSGAAAGAGPTSIGIIWRTSTTQRGDGGVSQEEEATGSGWSGGEEETEELVDEEEGGEDPEAPAAAPLAPAPRCTAGTPSSSSHGAAPDARDGSLAEAWPGEA